MIQCTSGSQTFLHSSIESATKHAEISIYSLATEVLSMYLNLLASQRTH